jgi:hypothetical protein
MKGLDRDLHFTFCKFPHLSTLQSRSRIFLQSSEVFHHTSRLIIHHNSQMSSSPTQTSLRKMSRKVNEQEAIFRAEATSSWGFKQGSKKANALIKEAESLSVQASASRELEADNEELQTAIDQLRSCVEVQRQIWEPVIASKQSAPSLASQSGLRSRFSFSRASGWWKKRSIKSTDGNPSDTSYPSTGTPN